MSKEPLYKTLKTMRHVVVALETILGEIKEAEADPGAFEAAGAMLRASVCGLVDAVRRLTRPAAGAEEEAAQDVKTEPVVGDRRDCNRDYYFTVDGGCVRLFHKRYWHTCGVERRPGGGPLPQLPAELRRDVSYGDHCCVVAKMPDGFAPAQVCALMAAHGFTEKKLREPGSTTPNTVAVMMTGVGGQGTRMVVTYNWYYGEGVSLLHNGVICRLASRVTPSTAEFEQAARDACGDGYVVAFDHDGRRVAVCLRAIYENLPPYR